MEEQRRVIKNIEPPDMDHRLVIADNESNLLMTIIGSKVVVHRNNQMSSQRVIEKALGILKERIMEELTLKETVSVSLAPMIREKDVQNNVVDVNKIAQTVVARFNLAMENKMFEDDVDDIE